MSPATGSGTGSRHRVTIRSISCRGVKAFVPFQKPPLYAAVSLGGRREKTPADADGGENPDWDGAAVAFDLDAQEEQEQQQLLRFEVKAQVPLLGNKLVGTASVPVADLQADGAALRHVSYQVSGPDGKPNGTLSFAYAIISSSGAAGEPQQPQLHAAPDPAAAPQQGPSFFSAPTPVTAYPAPSTTANFAPHGGVYPPQPSPPASGGSLYPPLQDLLPSSTYPAPPPLALPHHPNPATASPHNFPGPQNSSSYPPPLPAQDSVYPPLPPAPDSVYPSPPPAPGSVYPSPPSAPGSGSVYPPPPLEPGSAYHHLFPRSSVPSPSSSSSSVDRELAYHPAPSPTTPSSSSPPGGSYYPYPPPELDGAAARTATPYYYYSSPPGNRYPS